MLADKPETLTTALRPMNSKSKLDWLLLNSFITKSKVTWPIKRMTSLLSCLKLLRRWSKCTPNPPGTSRDFLIGPTCTLRVSTITIYSSSPIVNKPKWRSKCTKLNPSIGANRNKTTSWTVSIPVVSIWWDSVLAMESLLNRDMLQHAPTFLWTSNPIKS